VPDLADLGAASDQVLAGGDDVVDDEEQALERAGAIVVVPLPNWIDACEPGGVNCTARMPGAGSKSMSSRQPRAW
jgi:hypothetical protein